jgi:hypothetical protein
MLSHSFRALALASAGLVLIGCGEPDTAPVAPSDQPTATVAKPGEPGSASDRILYQARLAALGDFRSRGVVLIELVGGHLAVTVHAAGLEPGQIIPQHIHLGSTCALGGGILINLDATLSVPGEGPGTGPAYPVANAGGVVNYYASRSLTDLLAAVNEHHPVFTQDFATVEALLAGLDLENRNAHSHIPTPPFTPVNCGEIERLN